MHLADYEEGAINSRIWTQTTQFEEKLAEMNEHMEKVIQMYLRNEYATIAEYNARAGSIAEKYHFLVIASFPVNFSDVAAKRLRNIAANGARCGVYTLVHWDQRNAPLNDFVPNELRKIPFVFCAAKIIFTSRIGASRGQNCFSIRRHRRNLPRNFYTILAKPAEIPRASKFHLNKSRPPTIKFGRKKRAMNCAWQLVVPAQQNYSISKLAERRGNTRSSRAKPDRANPRCFTSSSRTSRSGAVRSRWNFISWISRKELSSNAMRAVIYRMHVLSPSKATALLV